MRRLTVLLMAVGLLMSVLAAPAAAETTNLDGPDPAIWLADPDGTGNIQAGDSVANASGSAKLNNNGASIKVKATGLEPGHTYTMWIVYFNDQTACEPNGLPGDCDEEDVNGIAFGDGKVVGGSGKATFSARLNDGADYGLDGPPPFSIDPYDANEDNEFHVVIRSHGPKIPGLVGEQINTIDGGCTDDPAPGEVPVNSGECGDVQLYIFS
jgi:hypothetical protein